MPRNGKPHRTLLARATPWLVVGGVALLAWFALAAWSPNPDPRRSICWSRRVLDLSCAGCGMTRALAALAQGRWSDSLTLHPLAPLLLAQAGLLWAFWGLSIFGLVRSLRGRWIGMLLVVNAVALVVLWVVRLANDTLPR